MAKRTKHKTGRPEIPIDWAIVDSLLEAGCKGTEIAGYLGFHEDTLYNRTESEKGVTFSTYSAEKRSKGDSILRVKQFESAVTDKNITMQIWLGKQRLEQKDNVDITSGGNPILQQVPAPQYNHDDLKK
jgi:hypothetical protein